MGHDFGLPEEGSQATRLDARELVVEVAFGDDHLGVVPEFVEHIGDAIDQLDGSVEQGVPEVEDRGDLSGTDATVADIDGALDQRQGVGLHAVAVLRHVARLDLEKVFLDRRWIAVVAEQGFELAMAGLESVLVVPQRVVGIEPDDHDRERTGVRCGVSDGRYPQMWSGSLRG